MIKPYYDEDGVTIYHADCNEVFPQLPRVDLLLTDPPYGIGEAKANNASRSKLAVAKDYGVSTWDDKTAAQEIVKARALSTHQIIFGGNYYELPPTPCWLIWDKDNGASDFADCEMAWTNLKKAARLLKFRWAGMLQEPGADRTKRFHPTQKPEQVIHWVASHAPLKECQIIFDPFMGSGTTLVVAKQLGKRTIGIEREEKYCEVAVKRLAQDYFNFGD